MALLAYDERHEQYRVCGASAAFRDQFGHRYLATLGTCVLDQDHVRVGGMVYAVNKDEVNFAIVRIDRRWRLDPGLPLYGGPVRVGPAPAAPAEAYVYSPYREFGGPNARSGVLWGDARAARVVTDVTFGNGGSVMLPDGTLVGYLGASIGDGYNVTLFAAALERTFRRTRLRLTPMTAPLAKQGEPPRAAPARMG